jgi:hypothetical protein
LENRNIEQRRRENGKGRNILLRQGLGDKLEKWNIGGMGKIEDAGVTYSFWYCRIDPRSVA